MKKRFYETRGFGVAVLLFGIFGLLLIAHHIISYENILRPYMDYLIKNRIITNNINGETFLYFFTNQSNIFADLFLIFYGCGLLGSKTLYRLTHNEKLRGALTLYVCITGIIYFAVLLPFSSGGFPMEKSIWFSNVVNVWNHAVVPVCFTVFWFFPLDKRHLPAVKSALIWLVYPLAYFAFSVIRGAITDFYPYPFLNGKLILTVLFGDHPYQDANAILLLTAVVLILSAIFFGVGCILCAIHNKIVSEKNNELI